MQTQLEQLERRLIRAERRVRVLVWVALVSVIGAIALTIIPRTTAQGDLEMRVAALEDLLQNFSRDGDDVFIDGANLHITNGMANTETANGLGNLIVGYNELRGGGDNRTGSHNVVVGNRNNYSSWGGLVIGRFNTLSGAFASVSGGQVNEARGFAASVSGGANNLASGPNASVSGGQNKVLPQF